MDKLQKKKPEVRSLNRAGQSLIRQLSDADDIEAELDKVADDYYDAVDAAKEKFKETKEQLKKAKEFIEIIEIIEVWVIEVFEILENVEHGSSEPGDVKLRLKQIEDAQKDIVKHSLKFKVGVISNETFRINMHETFRHPFKLKNRFRLRKVYVVN